MEGALSTLAFVHSLHGHISVNTSCVLMHISKNKVYRNILCTDRYLMKATEHNLNHIFKINPQEIYDFIYAYETKISNEIYEIIYFYIGSAYIFFQIKFKYNFNYFTKLLN